MVLSPQKLWENYNRSLLPLDESVIRTSDISSCVEKYVYFNGEATSVGCTRIFARLIVPKEKTENIVIAALSPESDITVTDFSSLIQNGYAVLAVDYAGDYKNRERFTIYPSTLKFADYNEDTLFSFAPSQKTCWYVWTTVLLRSITFAEQEGFKKIALMGEGIGGSHVFKVASISDFPVCAVSVFSPGFFPAAEDPEMLATVSSIGISSYAPTLKVPLMQICCSNDLDSSLDKINELSEQTENKAVLYIAPRINRSFTKEIHSDILKFLSFYFNREEKLPSSESLSKLCPNFVFNAGSSDNKLSFTVICKEKVQDISLYVSHAVKDPAFRNWRLIPMEKVGEEEYIGWTDVYSSDKPVFGFVCITTSDGFVYSSNIIKKIPSALNILPSVIVKKRLIYESEMGIDDFFATEGSPSPVMKEGPFGISGICAKTGLCTYKVGDVSFSGECDGVLQLLMFSPVEQNIKFTVIDEEQFLTYSCEKSISPKTDWTKIMISASDLKSKEGSLSGWDKAIFLQIDASEEIIISSLLWV